MIQKKITILDPIGFHARTAALFAKKAALFQADILIHFNGKKVNGKSTLALMTLGVKSQNEIEICASGEDEESAMMELTQLIESNFNS
jgi:phosphocarrier protein